MARERRKAINFDLDTSKMRDMELYPYGYRRLERSFQKLGFEHRQGSGYVSVYKISESSVYGMLEQLVTENPWLIRCAKRIDVTDIGRQHDLTALLQGFVNMSEELDELPEEDNGFVLKM